MNEKFRSKVRSARLGAAPAALAAAISLAAGGCGRKATVEDCERIVERIAELHLKREKLVPQKDVQEQVRQTQAELRARAHKECVGKRIPNGALQCLEQAETPEAAIEDCL